MDKELLQLNAQAINKTNELKKQLIISQINSAYDINDQIAIIFNALELLVNSLPDGEHKSELVALLDLRNEIKKEENV